MQKPFKSDVRTLHFSSDVIYVNEKHRMTFGESRYATYNVFYKIYCLKKKNNLTGLRCNGGILTLKCTDNA